MTIKPQCPKANRTPGSPAVFCQGGSYCAHQYLCPATRRYENSEWQRCRRLDPPAAAAPQPSHPSSEKENARPQEDQKKVKEDKDGAQKVNKRRRRKG